MKPGLLLLSLGAVFATASPALACRERFRTEADVRDRTMLYAATVESLERRSDQDGQRIFATLRTEHTIYGEPPTRILADDYLPNDDDPNDGQDVIMVTSGCHQRWMADELAALSVGDEVIVLAWKQDSGAFIVTDLGRTGSPRAQRLVNAPRP